MFWKLVKYELKTVNKWYLGLYAGIMALSVVIGLWIRGGLETGGFWSALFSETAGNTVEYPSHSTNGNIFLEIFSMVTIIAFFSLLVALSISTLFLIIRRFKRSVYDREGYLTLTLPVSKHEIILSKLTSAFLWTILSTLTLIISVLLISLIVGAGHIDWSLFKINTIDWIGITQGLLYFFFSTISSILLIYLAISIGQLFNDNRVAFGFLTYFAITIIISILSLTISTTLNIGEDGFLSYAITQDIVLSLLYYFGTYYILKNKVNLQ
ncbi:ABC transporter ATP-binding protein [Streptococcus pneumoniae]